MSDRPHFAHLELIIGGETRRIELPATRICRFGRGPDNTVVIADQLASRNHALIDCRNEREYFLTDLGSRNGTFLNGSRVLGPARLSEGDRINVGEQTFLFRDAIQRNAFEATPSQVQTEIAQPTVVMVSLEVITVLVVDIRNYSHWSRELGEAKLTAVISSMVQQADVMLRRNGAWGQKYIGDAIMAIWKHSRSESNESVLDSVLASTAELFRIVSGLQKQFGFDTQLQIGAGINTGPASLGNLGGDGTADYTALGDAVNKAFRLEAATRTVGCDILIGDSTYDCLDAELRSAPFRKEILCLKGYPDPQPAFGLSVEELERRLQKTGKTSTSG